MYVYVFVHACTCVKVKRTTCGNWFSLSTLWVWALNPGSVEHKASLVNTETSWVWFINSRTPGTTDNGNTHMHPHSDGAVPKGHGGQWKELP